MPKKDIFLPPKENENIIIEFCIFELIYVPSYSLNWQFWVFGYNLRKNDIFSRKQKKWTEPLNSEYSNYVGMIIPNSTFNFQPKLTILNFGIKFAQKWYFRLKTKNVSITINFCIYEILLMVNLSLNWQLWFFGPDIPKKDISGRKQIKSTSPWNSTYLRVCLNKISKSQEYILPRDNCFFPINITKKFIFRSERLFAV